MKTNKLLSLVLMLCLGVFASPTFADVTKTVGTNGADFATLQLAFDDINNNVGGNYTGIIDLQVIDNTTETAAAILNASANWTSVKIYPTVAGKSIEGDLNTPLITLNGASNVTIDGRLRNASGVLTGSTKGLTISNANAGTGASTIFLTANASGNTVTYATIKGASAGSNGTIKLLTASATDGMANNTFSYNLITGISATVRPLYSVYAKGTEPFLNKGNKIENNEFKDFLNLGATSNAIYIDAFNDSWTISGNSFYETSATFNPSGTGAYTIIQIAGGPSHTISGNYIGGSAANGVGTWTKNSSTNNNFTGISVVAGASSTSTITNNTIKNIAWTSGTAAVTWKAIDVTSGAGDVAINSNTIGSATGTESIIINNTVTSSVYLIHIQNAGNATCQNNTIGAIKTDNAAANSTSLYAIAKATNVTGNVTISSNVINNLTTNSASTGTAQGLAGIFNNGGTGNITINSNTITNLVNNTTNSTTATAGSTAGIRTTKGVNVITNNSIHDLTNANANTAGTHQASVIGIAITGSAIDISTVNKNTIYNLSNTRTDFAGYVLGMHFVGKAGSVVNGNFIHGLSATSATAKLGGIRIYEAVCAATFSNNIISLGSNTASSVIGIAEALALLVDYNTNYYHNTIYIYGTPTAGTSICYYSASTANLRVFKNNLFVNKRSGGASNSHSSFQTSATGLTSDYNLYYVSGTGSVLANIGGAKADLAALQLASGGDQNSLSTDPLFATPEGIYPFDYKANSTVSLPGAINTGILLDFADITRSLTAPRMGAYETSGATIIKDAKLSNCKIIATASGIMVPVSGHATIELYNVNGMLIERKIATGNYNRDLQKGIYIIKVNGEITKFMK